MLALRASDLFGVDASLIVSAGRGDIGKNTLLLRLLGDICGDLSISPPDPFGHKREFNLFLGALIESLFFDGKNPLN